MDTAMPLQLLQPLDSNNPASTPVHLSGPEQRLTVTPDPAVGDESLLPPSQLLFVKDGESRSIWPVHLAGWQALGWHLHTQPQEAAPEPQPEPEPEPFSEPEPEPEPAPQPSPELVDALDLEPEQPAATEPASAPDEPTPTDEPLDTTTDGGEALLASEPTDFQAMTKAQIVEFCSTVYGVELDSTQTKAELVEQATALEAQASGSTTATSEGINDAADLAALELGDALL
jgi:outer membrane biosynthesis protein TonB